MDLKVSTFMCSNRNFELNCYGFYCFILFLSSPLEVRGNEGINKFKTF